MSNRYRLRWTVGSTFDYQKNMEFDKGRWVDIALVVESPKMTLYMCCEDGPEGSVTNKFSKFEKTFSGSPRPAITANKRKFVIGSTGDDKAWAITYTNGVNTSSSMAADFRGVFHQYAFWDRTLSIDEVRKAMGRGALVRVGLVGNLGNGEFVATKTSVDAERDWEELNPVLTAENPSAPKFSFANLVAHHHPIVVVDEAHHMVTDLSQKALSRLMPAAILGLTATPGGDNNVLYSVYAQELFDEQMVKLPIELTEFKRDWEKAVAAAIAKRTALAEKAAAENASKDADRGGYLKPIVLFQATAKNGEVPVEKLRAHLIDVLKIPEGEIRVATGEQKELDDVDVTDPTCKVNYIITVQALKEGWDCPFAYVFCSLANVGSSKDTIQLLGRVMRMPYAKRRKTRELNRAYATIYGDAKGGLSPEQQVNSALA